jgi:RNA polymerase sigma-70 factor (ECF subfamily)
MTWLPRLLRSTSADSDEQTMRRLQTHTDHAAFAELMSRWEARVRRLCYRMTGDAHRSEDLAQETFSRVFANRHQFDHSRKFSTWLWRIALNLCYEESRRAGRRGELRLTDDRDDETGESGPLEQAMESERTDLLRRAVMSLPETHRAIVMLREYEQLKFRQIAEVLDVPEGTVKWWMTEALNQLNERLGPLLAADEPKASDKTSRSKERLLL